MKMNSCIVDACDVDFSDWKKAIDFKAETPEYIRFLKVDGEYVLSVYSSAEKAAALYAAELAA